MQPRRSGDYHSIPHKVKSRQSASLMEHAFYDIMSPDYKMLRSDSSFMIL